MRNPKTVRSFISLLAITIVLASSAAEMRGWNKPSAGSLYVLDWNAAGDSCRLLVVDPVVGNTIDHLDLGYQAVIAVAHNGRAIYSLSGRAGEGIVSSFDTLTGKVKGQASIPHRVIFTLLPSVATLAVSRDDKWVFVENMRFRKPGADEYSVSVLHASSLNDTSHSISVPGCGPADLVPGTGDWDLAVHCPFTNSINAFAFASDGSVNQSHVFPLPYVPKASPPAESLPTSQRRASVAGLMEDGIPFSLMSDGTFATSPANVSGAIFGQNHRYVPIQHVESSNDGRFLYVGCRSSQNAFEGQNLDEVVVMNLAEGKQAGSVTLSLPFFRLAVSNDGKTIYAVSPTQRSIVMIDSGTQKVVRTLNDIGLRPIAAAVVPTGLS